MNEVKATIEPVSCNLCGADDYVVVYSPAQTLDDPSILERYSAASTAVSIEQIVKCKKCGLVYVNPRLNTNQIVHGYSQGTDEAYVSQREGRKLTFQCGLRLIEGYRPEKGRILDVGCAAGFFLKVAKENGWDAVGVEPNVWLGEYGRNHLGVEIRTGTLKDADFKDGAFDVVTMWDVLEHTPDPTAVLRESHRVLKDKGLLVINFPDFSSIWAKVLGRKWWWCLSVHLYYFTPQTLEVLLRKTGYEVLSVRRHYQYLQLGYLVYRLKVYSPTIYRLADLVIRTLRLSEVKVPYTASQTNMFARKL